MKKFFLLMLSVFAFCAADAQVTTSGMNGTVTDADGQPLAGATVIAVHTPSGTQYGAVSDKNGGYNLQGLRTGGPYTVTFSFVGCQSVEFPGLMLSLGQTLKRDAFLKDSQQLEAVVITADGKNSSMNVNRAGAVTSISNEQIELMPTVNRSMNDIMRLTPQASSTTSGLAIGGGNYRQSYVTVDGAAFNNMFGIGGNLPAGGSPISLDALEQVSVSITPFDVRQSGFTGGAINAVTKSGTNDLKVSAYLYSKSDQLQGDKYDGGKLSLSEMRNNTLGFSVGAPIVRNKLFVFANFEREWNTTPGNSRLARTSESQDFGKALQYNRPTTAKLDEMSRFLIDNYGYNPGAYQNYSVKTPGYKLMARVDWNINRNHALNVRFSRTQNKYSSAPSSSISPLNAGKVYDKDVYGRTSVYAMYFGNSRYYQEQNFTSVAAELNSRFMDSRLTNTLRYTYSHQYEPRSYDGGIFPTVDILEPAENGASALYASFGLDPFTEGNLREVSTHILTDEIGYTLGKHRLVAGLQFEHNLTTNGYLQGGAGYYVYESWDDFKNDKAPLAFRIAHGNNDDLSQAFPEFSHMQYSVYLQDEINVSDRFKATVGVRFEVPVYPSISGNENKDFTEIFAEHGGYKTSDMPKARLSVAPRVGFNWDMTGERKYILRGGTGVFNGRLPFVWLVSVAGNSNTIQNGLTLYRNEKGDNMPKFHTNVKDMLEDVYKGTYKGHDLAANTQPTILDKNLKMPSTWKSSLALDLKLPGDVNLNIEGIYNKDFNSVTVTKLGMVEKEGGIRLPGEPEARTYWESGNIRNKDGETVNPYLINNTDDVDGYYASVSAQVSKTWGFGLSLTAAYTYSSAKNVIDGIGDQVTSAFSTNTFNKNGSNVPELGYASYVSPHRILLNVGYRLAHKSGASNFGLYYEAFRQGYIGSYSYSRYSYTMYVQSGKYQNPVTNDRGAVNLIYIPTREELDGMPFTSDENREEYWKFIRNDDYLSKHTGEYSKRGGAVMPWQHMLNFRFSQDFYVNVYASVSAQVSKTWGFGLSLTAAYTYSSAKNVIDGIGDQVTSAFSTNTFNKNGSNVPELGYASYVSPHRILLNVGYRLAHKSGASNFGLYYEAFRQGYIGSYSYSRYSYTMYVQSGKYQNPVTNDRGAVNLIYIPTREELDGMPFTSDENREEYWKFIRNDDYLSKHTGEYSKRGGAVMPWQHMLNFRFSQDFYVNVKGRRNTISLGLDVNNIANMLNRDWGNVKRISTTNILKYENGAYTFNKPTWSKYAGTISTWSAMFSIRYTFN